MNRTHAQKHSTGAIKALSLRGIGRELKNLRPQRKYFPLGWLVNYVVYMAIKPSKLLVRPVCVLLVLPTMLSMVANCWV